MSAAGAVFLKLGAGDIRHDLGLVAMGWQIATNWRILSGVVLYCVPVLIWIFMLKKVDISFLQPLFSSVYVLTPILATVFLHEHVPPGRWLGIGIVLIGVFIIARH